VKKALLPLALAMALLCACAQAAPSKTAADVAQVVALASSGETPAEDFSLVIVRADEAQEKELARIAESVLEQGAAPVDCFSPAVKQAIAARLPADVPPEALELTEFVPLAALNYRVEYGDVTADLLLDTPYAPEQTICALIGLFENGVVTWIWTEAEITPEGNVRVTFSAAELRRMSEAQAVSLAILSAPWQAESEQSFAQSVQ